MRLSLKCVNKQHCPHYSLPLSFIPVLPWYIFLIIFIPVLEAIEWNHFDISYCMSMSTFALTQTVTTHNYSFKWMETSRPQWPAHSARSISTVYIDMSLGYHTCSFIICIYKTDMFFYVSCLVMLYLIWRLRAHVWNNICVMLCYCSRGLYFWLCLRFYCALETYKWRVWL